MARCLVTGHKGYIGSHLFSALQEIGHEVIGIDLKEESPVNILEYRGLKENDSGSFHFRYWNFKPEYIFHLACKPRVAYSVEEPVATMENNVLATTVVLNFARKVGAKRVIYAGSSSVIGDSDGPTSPYGLQKLISEMECKLYSKLYGLDTVTLRYFNVYSPDQKADGPYATAVSNFMQYIRERKSPFITGDGTQRRDMANVADVVSANIFAMQYKEKFNGQYFDVGTGDNISLNQIKDIVYKYFSHVKFKNVEKRKGDVFSTRANMKPLKNLGWEPQVNFYDGIEECFRKLKNEL